jgi:hypothetical protein
MSDLAFARAQAPRRPRADAANRARGRAVATFLRARIAPGGPVNALVALAHVAREFPNIGLEAALVGVFRELLRADGDVS